MTGNEFQNKAQDAAKAVKDAGRETFDAAKSELSEAAKEVKSTLRDEADTRARAGKDLVADQGQRIARDLRDAAGSQGVESFQGRLLDTVASGVSDISEGLRDQKPFFDPRTSGAFRPS